MTITTTTLKNAAFAIEHDLFTDPDGSHYLVKDGAILRRWEPEASSADAFELAVKLSIAIYQWDSGGGCSASHIEQGVFEEVYCGRYEDSVYCEMAASRLAILRAASAIGESLKCQS